MLEKIIEKVHQFFSSVGIKLDTRENGFRKYEIKDSITNTFFERNDIDGNKYIIRVNGKLWPPFTRENEASNLTILKHKEIFTGVMCNDKEEGFQICIFPKTRFSDANYFSKTEDIIRKIGSKIKQIHELKDFKLTYEVSSVIYDSFQKNSGEVTVKLYFYYSIIMPIIRKIEEDSLNIVSSHNDLLPSSVCYRDKDIYFIDWEYSAKNHRSYDLALLAIKSSFNFFQEAALLKGYDPEDKLDSRYYTTLMKAVISFLLLQWKISKNIHEESHELEKQLNCNIQEAYTTQAFRQHFYPKLSFFKKHSYYSHARTPDEDHYLHSNQILELKI